MGYDELFYCPAWRDALVATTKPRSGLLWIVCDHFQQKLDPDLVQPLLASVPPERFRSDPARSFPRPSLRAKKTGIGVFPVVGSGDFSGDRRELDLSFSSHCGESGANPPIAIRPPLPCATTAYGESGAAHNSRRHCYRCASQPYGYFLQRNSGDLLKKVVGDVGTYTGGVLLPLLDGTARALTAALLLGTLFLVQPMIALAAAVGLGAFYVTVFRLLAHKRREVNEGLRTAFGGSFCDAQQMLGGIKPIKVHRAEEHFLSRFARHSAVLAQMHARVPIVANITRYLAEPLAFGGLVLAVVLLAARERDFSAILPNLGVMAVAGYRAQVTQLTSMRYSLDAVFEEFIDAELDDKSGNVELSAEKSRPLEWQDAITLDEVSFIYPGADRPVLDRFSVTIQKNTSIGFIGPTGSGKSTLIDLLLGLHRPTSGRVLIDGQPLTPELIPSWQATIGYVPQELFLIDDTIARNIAFGVPDNEIDNARLQEVCAMAQILDFIETELRDGFQTTAGERGVRLSGGERQRLGLARALYHRPSLLLLDEATSALDTATEAKLIEALRNLSGKLTIVIVAHRFTALAGCDKLVDLSHETAPVAETAK